MGREILFSVLIGGALLLALLPFATSAQGWKGLLLPLLGIAALLAMWTLVRI